MSNNCIDIADNFKERVSQTVIWFLEGLITGVVCGLTIYSYKVFSGNWMIVSILLSVISVYSLFTFIRQMYKVMNIFREEVGELERDWKEFEKVI